MSSSFQDDAARQAAHERRIADIENALRSGAVPSSTRARLEAARGGRLPWLATLTPTELMVARSHQLKPIAAVSATCWMHYGWSWTEGHAQGWKAALYRLRAEANAAGANAVLDVKMRTVPLHVENSMDFTLVGTAVYVEGLPPSKDPVVATIPALEFVKLLEADVVATGIAIGAQYDWLADWRATANLTLAGNTESTWLSQFWETIRQRAHAQLRQSAAAQGNGVLAHINFGQMFEFEGDQNQPKRFLARQIVIATTVDTRRGLPFPHDIKMVIDLHAGGTALTGHDRHHQSYASNEQTGAI
jgi:hypothetical protein